MRRTILLLAGVLLSALALGSGSPREDDDKIEVVAIEGVWRMVGDEKNVLTCRGGHWTIDGDGGRWLGTYRIDNSRMPAHLDLFYANGPFAGKTFKFIYQIDRDTLKIACLHIASQRPHGFNDESIEVFTRSRVKK